MKRLGLVVLCALLAAGVAGAKGKGPPPGTLDPGFSDIAGRVLTSFGPTDDEAHGVAFQKDRKVVAAGTAGGDFAVSRTLPDGQPDPDFNNSGKTTLTIGNGMGSAEAVAIQPDGKIVAAGYSKFGATNRFAVLRLFPGGATDATFDGDGVVDTPIGTNAFAEAVAVTKGGKIVVAGRASMTDFDFAIVRYNPNGSLDTTFDGDGIKTTDASGIDYVSSLVVTKAGKIVIGGNTWNGTDFDLAVARYNPDGSPDTTFDGDGLVTTDLAGNEGIAGLALQKDGKIVATGAANGVQDVVLARYLPSGPLDATFSGGTVVSDLGGNETGAAVAVQSDGKILVTGSQDAHKMLVARYGATGALDATFGNAGVVAAEPAPAAGRSFALAVAKDGHMVAAGYGKQTGGTEDFALLGVTKTGVFLPFTSRPGVAVSGHSTTNDDDGYALALQPDGKLVAAGLANNSTDNDFAVLRENTDGTLDTSFGTGGTQTVSFGSGDDVAYGVALQPDGKIVLAGLAGGGGTPEFGLARLDATGQPDDTFDTDGRVTTPVGTGGAAFDVLVQPDGKIVAAGYSVQGTYAQFTLVRYNADGSLDTSFDGDGIALTPIGVANAVANALVRQPDGKLVACGYANNGTDNDYALARYLPDGSLDPSFLGGTVTEGIQVPGFGDICYALALQKDGKLVAAGVSDGGVGVNLTVFRLMPWGPLDSSWNGNGAFAVQVGQTSGGAMGVAVDPKGRVAVGGYGDDGTNLHVVVARLAKSGKFDSKFNGGLATARAPGATDSLARAMALTPGGAIAVAGSTNDGTDDDTLVMRFAP